jgi:hypothetical protein
MTKQIANKPFQVISNCWSSFSIQNTCNIEFALHVFYFYFGKAPPIWWTWGLCTVRQHIIFLFEEEMKGS